MIRRRSLLLLCAAVSPSLALAQSAVPPAVDRGSLVLGGGAAVSRTRTEFVPSTGAESTDDATQLSLTPSLLYFVRPGLAVGGEASFTYTDRGEVNSTAVGVGPAVRYYFARGATRTLPYVGASARLGRISTDGGDGGTRNTSQWGFEGTAGLTWLLSRQVGILGEAYVNRFEQALAPQTGPSTLDLTVTGFGLRFGVAAFLPRGR